METDQPMRSAGLLGFSKLQLAIWVWPVHALSPPAQPHGQLYMNLSQLYLSLLGCSVGTRGFEVDHRGQPAAVARAGIAVPSLEQQDTPDPLAALPAAERASVAEAAAASVAADVGLRTALLEGLCLFASGAVTGSQAAPSTAAAQGAAGLAEIPRLLTAEVASRAESAAQAAIALQQSLRAQHQQQEGEGAGAAVDAATGSGAMVAVPDARAVGDEEVGGRLPEVMPPRLMQFPSCRAMQLGLLALQVSQPSLRTLLV